LNILGIFWLQKDKNHPQSHPPQKPNFSNWYYQKYLDHGSTTIDFRWNQFAEAKNPSRSRFNHQSRDKLKNSLP